MTISMILFLKAAALRLTTRFVETYAAFREDCNDQEKLHYEVAVRLDGLNIEHLPSRGPNGEEGKNITVYWT